MLKRKLQSPTSNINKNMKVYDRVSKLLGSFEWSDCSFWIGKRRFPGHRLILGISSPVFKAMLYGGLATTDDIVVSDIEPDTFQLLLSYVYTDRIDIASMEQAFGLLYAAKKYMLEHLTDKCVEYIEDNTTVDNVFTVLSYADFIQENKLFKSTLLLVSEHSNVILQPNVDKLSSTSIKALLQCDKINIKEKDLINVVFQWSKHACDVQNMFVNKENRRKVLMSNGIWKLLRFFTLSSEELHEIEDNLLMVSEMECIESVLTEHIDSDLDKKTDFVNSTNVDLFPVFNMREKLNVRWNICHRCPMMNVPPLRVYASSRINIKMMVNKTLFINSLGVPTRMSPQTTLHNPHFMYYTEQFSVAIGRSPDDHSRRITNFSATLEYDTTMFVELTEPYMMKKDEWYTITFLWPSNLFHFHKYAVSQRDSLCKTSKVRFQFQENLDNYSSFLEMIKYSF